MAELPVVDDDLVVQCRSDFEKALNNSSQEAYESAKLRFTWALIHSCRRDHIARGLGLAEDSEAQKHDRETEYLIAVAMYKLGRHLEARRVLARLLESDPGFRQAETLKAAVDDAVVKDGLVGMGVVAAVAGVGAALIFGLAGKR